jgi:hypothetical protein
VSHPNRDHLALSEEEKQKLQELLQSPFLRKYCKGDPINEQKDDSRFMLKHFVFLAPVFRYFAENKIPVDNI